MLKAMTTAALILAAAGAYAQDDLTIASLANGKDTRAQFGRMTKGRDLPRWVTKGGTNSPTREVGLGGARYRVLSACKPHDCASERMAVLYSADGKKMAGVYSVVNEKTASEKLVWLNVDGKESIDGKTVLYAALSGSLENHPQAFDFK
ncbi:MAG: Ivy family C-type lysozyme inhibitor [Candidatus Accumulibacter sp.]|jgi:hypothetical protein|nr:Ivy family C-type lysozyme inhibitor [Accumulibacter sp.]